MHVLIVRQQDRGGVDRGSIEKATYKVILNVLFVRLTLLYCCAVSGLYVEFPDISLLYLALICWSSAQGP